jgi:hypothetical protein
MQRVLIGALGAVFLAALAAPAFADDYPPCTQPGQDHCRVVPKHHPTRAHKHNRAVHNKKGAGGKSRPA